MKLATIITFFTLCGFSAARAAEPAPPPVVAVSHPPLFNGVAFGALVSASQVPSLILVGSYNSLLFGAGVQFSYNRAGLPDAGGAPTGDKVLMSAAFDLQYMVFNRNPVAIGPEVDYATSLAPVNPFKVNNVTAGVAFWYAPFNAPVLLGGAWLVSISNAPGAPTTVDLLTPALRAVLAFP
jgi:hypothetical protein